MKLNFDNYFEKVRGCFTGKTVGGTLGMKYEGNTDVHEITYYDPVPTGMLPNDDLDLQVINLECILRTGFPVCRKNLGELWQTHMADSLPDEYGVSVNNQKMRLYAPLSGQYNNKFTDGMGAAIRSELWACLAPANPALAAALSREDACNDHDGDGLYAEMFLAALESLAFIKSDLREMIGEALCFVPYGSRLKNGLCDVLSMWDKHCDVMKVREEFLAKYKVQNFTDVTINLAFILLSLVSGRGSFDKTICTAVGLGYDTDCTGATVGSIFGIMNPSLISSKWTNPIGEELILGHCVINMHQNGTIGDFCRKVAFLAAKTQKYYKTGIGLELPKDFGAVPNLAPDWTSDFDAVADWETGSHESLICIKPLLISLCYPEDVAAYPDKLNKYRLKITNITDGKKDCGITLSVPDGWNAVPECDFFSIERGESAYIDFTVNYKSAPHRANLNALTVTLSIGGLSFDIETGLVGTSPWIVTDRKSGKQCIFEATEAFFTVPDGEYTYSCGVYGVKKQARLIAAGTRPFKLFLDGKEIIDCRADYYVPAFHRCGNYVKAVELQNYRSNIEVVFRDGKAGEFFMAFGTLYACGEWVTTVEKVI